MTSSPVTDKFIQKTFDGQNLIYPDETEDIRNYTSGTFTTNTYLPLDGLDNNVKMTNVEAHDINPVQPMPAGAEFKKQWPEEPTVKVVDKKAPVLEIKEKKGNLKG